MKFNEIQNGMYTEHITNKFANHTKSIINYLT